jgi:hypothetical protein
MISATRECQPAEKKFGAIVRLATETPLSVMRKD